MTALAVRISAPPTGNLPCTGKQYLFYGKHAERPETRLRREEKAKKVCATCSQMTTCRDFARGNNEVFGIWGGETEMERYSAGFMSSPPTHLSRRIVTMKERYENL
jgi:WhiB family redox-sensing transcriptional regulator